MAIYSDEVSPGNQLKHTNQRKVQVLYWSLQELGEARRKDEQLAVSFAKMWLQRRHTHLSPWLGWCIMTGATPRNIIIKESLKLESFRKKKKVRVS